MKRQVLGLDIHDDHIAAAVVEQRGHEKQITSWDARAVVNRSQLAVVLQSLLEGLDWKGGLTVCGLSLSGFSLRNLTVPFTDRKNINQILPLELEDQLIIPVQDQVIEYIFTEKAENSSRILVAAMAKNTLRGELEMLRAGGQNPGIITLRNAALAGAYTAGGAAENDFILLDAGLHFITMVAVHKRRIVFMRRLPCPERIFTREAFAFTEDRVGIADFDEAMACIDRLGRDIQQNLGILRINGETEFHPDKVILTGAMSQIAAVAGKFSETLQLEVAVGNLQRDAGVVIKGNAEKEWEPAIMDHALALGLQGLGKRTVFNFRKGEFVLRKQFFSSRKRIGGAIAVVSLLLGSLLFLLGVDYRSLKADYDHLGRQMEDIYRETFPEATVIRDALAQMKANVRNIQAPSLATPVFANERRILNILADISARIPPEVTIHVNRMVIDEDSVQIKGDTDTFNNVNIIQSRLVGSPRFEEVNIISAAAEKNSSLIRFELRLKIGGQG